MQSKIRIKAGEIEIEYEGDAAFLKSGLKELFDHLVGGQAPQRSTQKLKGDYQVNDDLSTNTIARILNAKNGTDLATAAVANLVLNLNKHKFSQGDVLKEMQNAVTFYRKSYGTNLSRSLNNLVANGKLNLQGQDVFSLSHTELTSLQKRITNDEA